MQNVVSITSQGQLTVPKSIRDSFQLGNVSTKAVVSKKGNKIIVEPKKSFWALESSLQSTIRLSDADLKKARDEFSKDWGQKWQK